MICEYGNDVEAAAEERPVGRVEPGREDACELLCVEINADLAHSPCIYDVYSTGHHDPRSFGWTAWICSVTAAGRKAVQTYRRLFKVVYDPKLNLNTTLNKYFAVVWLVQTLEPFLETSHIIVDIDHRAHW